MPARVISRTWCAGLLLLWAAGALAQTAPNEVAATDPSAPPAAGDVEQMIATLEDPEARAELVRELRVLLQAQQQNEAAAAPSGDLLASLRAAVVDLWNALIAIDPRQLLISIAVSLLILLVAVIVRWLILRLLKRLYARLADSGDRRTTQALAADQAAAAPTLPAGVVRLINLIVGVIAVALMAESWGAGIGALLSTDLGSRMFEAGLSIGLILVLTMVAWHVAGFVVARLLTLASSSSDEERTARRLDTLVPLLRSVLQGVIGVLSALLILSELGVDIGPLLAGAGILGLAVGFGAQTLVKDLLTGVTILLEDGATVGDVVEVAGHSGVVEEMRIRILRLRDLRGAVHLIPYSEVASIVNFTKDYSYYLMDVGVAYREDTDDVCQVLHEVAAALRDDDQFGGDILEDLEILGVNEFADSAVVIRARLKTQPGRQWATGREFNRRMKMAFDERGIEIPFPHTTIYFGEPKQGSAPPAQLRIDNAEAAPTSG